MQSRTLGRTGLSVSALSLGTEYLIDLPRETVVPVIHEAIDRGINYFDLFWPQAGFRDIMGAAFKGHRSNVLLAAHLGAMEQDGQYSKTRDLAVSERFFHDFLRRFQTDAVDVLFLHNCDSPDDYDAVMGPGGLADLACRLREQGKARFLGFSGHTTATSLRAVQSGAIDVLMFSINMASHAVPGMRELLEACIAQKVGVVAMKPFAGGRLLREDRHIAVEDFQMGRAGFPGGPTRFETTSPITPVQCLSYVLAQPGVCAAVPGCKSLAELSAALGYLAAAEDERDYSAVLPAFARFATGECVYCNHCLPCPSRIDIGRTLSLLDQSLVRMTTESRASYGALPARARDCTQCGACAERCPFGVDVVARMSQAVALFGA